MKWFRRYNRRMEDRDKITEKLEELNKNKSNKPWIEVPDFFVMTGFAYGKTDSDAKFNADHGYPVKVFVHVPTGELKIYGAFKFRK